MSTTWAQDSFHMFVLTCLKHDLWSLHAELSIVLTGTTSQALHNNEETTAEAPAILSISSLAACLPNACCSQCIEGWHKCLSIPRQQGAD